MRADNYLLRTCNEDEIKKTDKRWQKKLNEIINTIIWCLVIFIYLHAFFK
jgi:hypothetical protein